MLTVSIDGGTVTALDAPGPCSRCGQMRCIYFTRAGKSLCAVCDDEVHGDGLKGLMDGEDMMPCEDEERPRPDPEDDPLYGEAMEPWEQERLDEIRRRREINDTEIS